MDPSTARLCPAACIQSHGTVAVGSQRVPFLARRGFRGMSSPCALSERSEDSSGGGGGVDGSEGEGATRASFSLCKPFGFCMLLFLLDGLPPLEPFSTALETLLIAS